MGEVLHGKSPSVELGESLVWWSRTLSLTSQSQEFLVGVRANAFRRGVPACPAEWVLIRALAVGDYVSAPLADSFRFLPSGHLLPSLLKVSNAKLGIYALGVRIMAVGWLLPDSGPSEYGC